MGISSAFDSLSYFIKQLEDKNDPLRAQCNLLDRIPLTAQFRRVYYLATLRRNTQSFYSPLTQFNIHSFRLHVQMLTVGRFVYVNAC